MDSLLSKSNHFKRVMHLIIVLGVCTNLFIATLLLFLSANDALFSPILGTVIFIAAYILLVKGILNVKQAFVITAYTVAAEVVVHTHYLGWDTGFFYYLYAISLVFLLDYSWNVRSVVLFHGSIIAITIITYVKYSGKPGIHFVQQSYIDNLSFFNQANIALVILLIVLYFSHSNLKKDRVLHEANDELESQNKEILEQRDHLQVLLKEVHHRVKNNLQIISSLLSLQSRSVKDKEVLAVLTKSKKRVEAIALIHQNLYGSKTGNQVDFRAYLFELIKSQQLMESNVSYSIDCHDAKIDLDIAVPLGLIISEMMTNSMKHAFSNVSNPKIHISFYGNSTGFELTFKDNGIGLPREFSWSQSQSLGVEIILALVEQIDATITFENDTGASFKIIHGNSTESSTNQF